MPWNPDFRTWRGTVRHGQKEGFEPSDYGLTRLGRALRRAHVMQHYVRGSAVYSTFFGGLISDDEVERGLDWVVTPRVFVPALLLIGYIAGSLR